MRYLLRDMLYAKRNTLGEYISIEGGQDSAKIVKLTMILRALSFDKSVLEDNLRPYIIDTVAVAIELAKGLLSSIAPDS